jgi:hypothetical protein
MTHRITNPDYVTLIVEVAVRTTVSLTVEIQVPRADADDLDFDAEDLLADDTLALKITHTGEANTNDTFNSDEENLLALDAAAAEALAEYRATLEGA